MQKTRILRNRLLAAAVIASIFLCLPLPARAASKEIVELQTQVQQLLDSVQRIQSTLDARLGVIQHLAEQTADDANRMTAVVTALQQKIAAQSDTINGKLDTASGQAQSLNDSVDELKSRIASWINRSRICRRSCRIFRLRPPLRPELLHQLRFPFPRPFRLRLRRLGLLLLFQRRRMQLRPAILRLTLRRSIRRRPWRRPFRPACATTTRQSTRWRRVSFRM